MHEGNRAAARIFFNGCLRVSSERTLSTLEKGRGHILLWHAKLPRRSVLWKCSTSSKDSGVALLVRQATSLDSGLPMSCRRLEFTHLCKKRVVCDVCDSVLAREHSRIRNTPVAHAGLPLALAFRPVHAASRVVANAAFQHFLVLAGCVLRHGRWHDDSCQLPYVSGAAAMTLFYPKLDFQGGNVCSPECLPPGVGNCLYTRAHLVGALLTQRCGITASLLRLENLRISQEVGCRSSPHLATLPPVYAGVLIYPTIADKAAFNLRMAEGSAVTDDKTAGTTPKDEQNIRF